MKGVARNVTFRNSSSVNSNLLHQSHADSLSSLTNDLCTVERVNSRKIRLLHCALSKLDLQLVPLAHSRGIGRP